MANIYQCAKFDENIFIYDWDMAKNKIQDGGRHDVNPCMANIYQCTKFDKNIFIVRLC